MIEAALRACPALAQSVTGLTGANTGLPSKEETMTTANGRSMVALLLALAVSACASSGGSNSPDVADTGTYETRQSACNALSQDECEASDECEPYLARLPESACPYPEVPMQQEYFGCHELLTCSQAATWAHPSDSPDDWYLFNDMCIPEGWVAGDWDEACGSGCEGLAQADCEAADHCFPVFGAPLLDGCISGDSQYAGCWTGEKHEDGEVVGISCATMVTWAHSADAPEEWYVFADSCVPDGWVSSEVDPCAPVCPGTHPWLTEPQSWKCDLPEGTVCSWPAEGCEPGQKPDNVCTCVEYGGKMRFECERPFHNCLPLEGSDVPEGTLTRPLPAHRETAGACGPEIAPRADVVCDNARDGIGSPENECVSDADCEGKWTRCLDSWVGGGDGGTLCTCQTADCLTDADCGTDELCRCGTTSEAEADWCGGPLEPGCMHECIPASCKTDDDCPGNQLCSPSKGMCQWRAVSYHCHDPEAAECFSAWECMGEDSWGCNFENGKGWLCQEIPMCD